jgi:hypothetical protein
VWKYGKYVSKDFIDKFSKDLIDDLYNHKPIHLIKSKYNQRMKRAIGAGFKIIVDHSCLDTKVDNKLKETFSKIMSKKYIRHILSQKRRFFMGNACYNIIDKRIELDISYYGALAIFYGQKKRILHGLLHDTIAHEIAHKCQHRSRRCPGFMNSGELGDFDARDKNKKRLERNWKKYLSCQSETEAWAISLASYAEKMYKNKTIALKVLHEGYSHKFNSYYNKQLFRFHKYGGKTLKLFLEIATNYLNS